jgi:aminoglycoside phosphotransferase (APT) family kinase protein
MHTRTAEGYDVPAVEAWIGENVTGLTPPFVWKQLEGGHSNLTYLLEAVDGIQAVIRRPPQGELLPNAHDMSREWSLISALGPTPVPVPTAIGFCDDPEVTGAHFYVMGLVNGRPLYNSAQTIAWVPADRRLTLAHSFIDVLADLHSLDPDKIGLGDLGKKDNYLNRQLKTWYRSWTSSIDAAQFDDPRAHNLKQYFLDHMPEQGAARVVHGDYGLHNCLIGADSVVVAVVDWEISTLGDPLADLAYALNPWLDPENPVIIEPNHATAVPGVPTRSELARRYAERTGRNLDGLNYYMGFSFWKSAAIMHGVYARYMAGQKSAEGVDLDAWRKRMEDCLAAAEDVINR